LSDEGSYNEEDVLDDDESDDEIARVSRPRVRAIQFAVAAQHTAAHRSGDDDDDDGDDVAADADDEHDLDISCIMPPPLVNLEGSGDQDDLLIGSSPISSPVSSRPKQALSAMMVDDKPWRSNRARITSTGSNSASKGHFLRYIRKPWQSVRASGSSDGGGSMSASNTTSVDQQPLLSSVQSSDLLLPDDDEEEDDSSLDAMSDGSSVESWELDQATPIEPWQEPVEWNSLAVLPNRFLNVHPTVTTAPPYLDPDMMFQDNVNRKQANRFVWEHGMLLQAAMHLLTERDRVGVEGKMDSDDNIWKKGPLKKLSYQVGRRQRPASTKWKVKYVELRRGNLCYYEDSGQGRKTIHLRQTDTFVQESENKPGYVFELSVQGSPARFWMASSEEERQTWIRRIRAAMIGGEEGSRRELDLGPHREALDSYQQLKEALRKADTQVTYLEAIQSTIQSLSQQNLTSLQLPVQWVRDQVQDGTATSQSIDRILRNSTHLSSPQKLLKSSIADFWRNMGETTFSINGLTVPRTNPMSSERIMGALTRCLLEFDKSFVPDEPDADGDNASAGTMSELQAVSYARNILLSILRSKEQKDAACAVNHLLENRDLVVVSGLADQEDAVVHMEVSFAGEDIQEADFARVVEEQAGWLWTRRKQSGGTKWRKRYACLSGTVLSYYAAASPRPHGLQGQLVLGGATVHSEESPDGGNDDNRYILRISTHDQERLLAFDVESEYYEWKSAIQTAIDSLQCVTQAVSEEEVLETQQQRRTSTGKSLLKGAERVIKSASAIPEASIRGSIRVVKGATGGGLKAIQGARVGGIKVIKGAVGRLRQKSSDNGAASTSSRDSPMKRLPSMQVLLNSTAVLTGKREPTVQCVVQTTITFGIAARDDIAEDGTPPETLISVRVKLFQGFLLSGGPSGRMARGDALVVLEFLDPLLNDDGGDDEEDSNFF
jgi:hypothetical protein